MLYKSFICGRVFISERRQPSAQSLSYYKHFCYCGNKFFKLQKQAHMKSGAPFDMNLQFFGRRLRARMN